jgi:hypothetical protein
MHFCFSFSLIFNEQEEYARKICSCIVSNAQISGHCLKTQEEEGTIQILQNRRTVKQDESYKYEGMCSQENGRRSGSKSCPIEEVAVDVDNEDYQRTITIRSLKT